MLARRTCRRGGPDRRYHSRGGRLNTSNSHARALIDARSDSPCAQGVGRASSRCAHPATRRYRRRLGPRPAMLPAAGDRARHAHRVECRRSPGMDCATPEIRPPSSESDVLVCLAAVARALDAEFQPRAFLDDLSTALHPLVPHDRLGIGYLADDRRTFSVFAEHGGPGVLPMTDRYTTDLRARGALSGRRLTAGRRCSTETCFASRTSCHRSALRSRFHTATSCWPLECGQRYSCRSWSVAASSAI